ncbi:latex clearing protein Lcp (plasmid) [Gordonia polyisoprenivorans VH2]|uniref:Latex clearing protein Lcp n=1 Tax=Gordonia polyisoprenivorans (strain DSM 44266 / VH2) TaxID=1112204 RepID=H6N4Z1_GORPV|nr:latex clearing protein Lcp [Gordonia polyisoprenivorans VH2]
MAFGTKPARAVPWAWSPAGSVVGSGSGADPRHLWDPEADPVIADVIEHHNVPEINKALRTWVRNDQPVPSTLPSNLRDFIEDARRLPSWTDKKKLADSFKFVKKQDTLVSVLYAFASGMMATVIPNEARAVYYSRGGSPVYFKDRIAKTAKLGYDIGAVNAYDPSGEMIVTCVKTRMIHAAVRHLLPQSPHWPAHVTPISQEDLMVTWHSLPTTIMQNLVKWKVPIPENESQGYLHSWQLCGHFLGIRDEYLPASWQQANIQAKQVLDPVLGPTKEGVVLADQLLDLGRDLDLTLLSKPILGAFTRFIMGDKLTDWVKIPREPVWSPLLETAWSPFVQIRSGVLGVVPPAENAYWLFDEFLRQFVLWYISELRMPISIEIPTVNRVNF